MRGETGESWRALVCGESGFVCRDFLWEREGGSGADGGGGVMGHGAGEESSHL